LNFFMIEVVIGADSGRINKDLEDMYIDRMDVRRMRAVIVGLALSVAIA